MKRLILFTALVLAGVGASAQQNMNDSLKEERLFKLLVRLKGTLLKEMHALDQAIYPDSIMAHINQINELCGEGILAIMYKDYHIDDLELELNDPSRHGASFYPNNARIGVSPSNTLLVVLTRISEAITYIGPASTGVKQRVLQLTPGLREAMIIY